MGEHTAIAAEFAQESCACPDLKCAERAERRYLRTSCDRGFKPVMRVCEGEIKHPHMTAAEFEAVFAAETKGQECAGKLDPTLRCGPSNNYECPQYFTCILPDAGVNEYECALDIGYRKRH